MGKSIILHFSSRSLEVDLLFKKFSVLFQYNQNLMFIFLQALGCILFRICYFKSAFDGESKLQILNGNYRIPELPKYSSNVTDLIRDMLQASPDNRPDITQASALLDWPFISMNLG